MRVSFDFDGTLADHFDGTPNDQKHKVIEALRDHQARGHDVYIVTKRYSPEKSSLGLVNEHIDTLRLAAGLSIPRDRVVFTDRALKADVLHRLRVDRHYDDCEFEADYFLRRYPGSSMRYVLVSRDPWVRVGPPGT